MRHAIQRETDAFSPFSKLEKIKKNEKLILKSQHILRRERTPKWAFIYCLTFPGAMGK